MKIESIYLEDSILEYLKENGRVSILKLQVQFSEVSPSEFNLILWRLRKERKIIHDQRDLRYLRIKTDGGKNGLDKSRIAEEVRSG